MRILFVSANREELPDPVPPLGLLYIHANTPEGHTKKLVDLRFHEEPVDGLREELDGFRPDLVALGLRNIFGSNGNNNVAYYRDLVAAAREACDAPVVVGGGAFSVTPAEMMQALRPDFGISGEGETSFALLVRQLADGDGAGLSDIPNLHYFEDGELRCGAPPARFQELDALARPDRALVDGRHYTECGTDAVQTKRGCRLHCTYCTYPIIEGRTVRRREPAALVAEMLAARKAQPDLNHFFIVDSVFNLPSPHAKDVCREMIACGVDTPWTCYVNPIDFDDELAGLMAEAGCSGIEIGSDSGVQATLDTLKKGFTLEAVEETHRRCREVGIKDCHTFILGAPGENVSDVHETLDFCKRLDPFAAVLMIYTDDHDALDPDSAEARARQASRAEIEDLLRQRRNEFPRWVIPSMGFRFSTRTFRRLRQRGATGPLWQHMQMAFDTGFTPTAPPPTGKT
jgi:hypothetical protein